MSTKRATQARYVEARWQAYRLAATKLEARLGVAFHLYEMSGRTDAAWAEQWFPHNDRRPPNGGWNWPEVRRKYRNDLDAFTVALWAPQDRLRGLAIGTLTADSLDLRAIENDPRPDRHQAIRVLPVVLEAATYYAELTGRRRLHLIEPASDRLVSLYRDVFGFELAKPKGGTPYCWREV